MNILIQKIIANVYKSSLFISTQCCWHLNINEFFLKILIKILILILLISKYVCFYESSLIKPSYLYLLPVIIAVNYTHFLTCY